MRVDLAAAADIGALPFSTEPGPEIEAVIREAPEDFRVEELPAYEPSGEGDHLYVRFEKTRMGTPEAVRALARALEIDGRDAGYAGLKDKHAVTVQWASFLFGDAEKLGSADLPEGLRVLETARHGNKLRTGHLRGNRFSIRLAGAPESALPLIEARVAQLVRDGVPNFFGGQRFGRGGGNLRDAARWLLDGGRAPRKPFHRKLYVSTLQSALFNELLAERIREGELAGVLEGDLLRKEENGAVFSSEALEEERGRAARFELSATGPMFGAKMRWPEGEARRREEAALARWGLSEADLVRFKKAGPGARRPYRVRLEDASVARAQEGLRVQFLLPSGAYATIVLREILRTPNVSEPG